MVSAKAEYEGWLKAGAKMKKGASAEDAGIVAGMVRVYGEIASRYSLDAQIGVSRMGYEASRPGMNIFQGGFFSNSQWKPRLELQAAQPGMHAIWSHEMNYVNASGYWLGLQQTCFSMMDEEVQDMPQTNEAQRATLAARTAKLLAWARILGEFSLRVLAVRCEFYRNSVRDPVSARANQEMYEEETYLPSNAALDDRARQIDTLRETQLMKAFAALSASNAVKRAGGGGGASE